MAENKRRNLGRGLDALLGKAPEQGAPSLAQGRGPKQVAVELLHPGRYQPRHSMDEERIEELAQSVRENGIIQPLLVRGHPDKDGAFEIIAGERRWRAAQLAKLHQVPVVVRDLNDQESLEMALVENLQRQDLSAIEEAIGYQRLMDEFKHTQEVLAKTVGKSRSHVANTMRLLALPDSVKKLLDTGALTAGHARALLNAPASAEAAKEVVKKGLNVRQTERLVKKLQRRKAPAAPRRAAKDVDTARLERDIADGLGVSVDIKSKGEAGSITLHYRSLEQLDDIIARLKTAAGSGRAVRSKKQSKPKVSIGLRRQKKKQAAG